MTSTNIFSGREDGRNSSRVLRPPGGGITDVLGVGKDPQPPQTRRMNPRNISSITEGTNVQTPINPEGRAEVVVPVLVQQSPSKQQAKGPEAEAPATQAAQRVRVPPGGFSSGLW